MTHAQEIHFQALTHLAHARTAMRRLMAVSDDAAAKIVLEAEFDEVEDRCREFGRCQLIVLCAIRRPL
jgi:hypothetical protein